MTSRLCTMGASRCKGGGGGFQATRKQLSDAPEEEESWAEIGFGPYFDDQTQIRNQSQVFN